MNNFSKKILAVIVICSIVFTFNFSKTYAKASSNGKRIKITTNALNFRTSPWGKKIGIVSYGQIYRVYSSKKDFRGGEPLV